MKPLLLLSCVLLASLSASAQNVRYDAPFPSISSTTTTPYLVANVPPNSPILAVCHSPANMVPCTNYATTYTSAGAACSNGAQDTPQPQPSACQAKGDAQGNIGFWAPAGGTYDYTVCVGLSCWGPYTVTLGGTGGGSGTLPVGQIGDTIRYNLSGSGQWNAANAAVRQVQVLQDAGALFQVGTSLGLTQTGSRAQVAATATDYLGSTFTGAASGSTSPVALVYSGQGGNSGVLTIGSVYRWTNRFAAASLVNTRIWQGLVVYLNGGAGTESVLLSSTKLATDTPNSSLIGFRYSAGVDTNWTAYSVLTGGTPQSANTGVPVDLLPHTFEITCDGVTARFFIDGVLVASITGAAVPATSLGNFVYFWSADNKNNATVVGGTHYWMSLSLK